MARSFVGLVLFTALGLSIPVAFGAHESCTGGQCEDPAQNADASVLMQQRVQAVVSRGAALAQELLNEVEEMEKSDPTGTNREQSLSKIGVIKDLVNDEILPDLTRTHASQAQTLATLNAAIGTCNTNAHTTLQHIEQNDQVSVASARQGHSSCRGIEATHLATKTTKCNDRDEFLGGIHLPAELPSVKNAASMGPYLESMSAYFAGPQDPATQECLTTKYTTFVGKHQECTTATTVYNGQKEHCNRNQSQFEEYFCQWRTRLTDVCESTLPTCYDAAKSAYLAFEAEKNTLVAKWKTEYEALQRILCHVEVWMSDNNVNTASGDQLSHCKNLQVDTSPMDIANIAVPDRQVCSMTAVEKYPGTSEFVTTEYANLAGAQQVNGCLASAPMPAVQPAPMPAVQPAPMPAPLPVPMPAPQTAASPTPSPSPR